MVNKMAQSILDTTTEIKKIDKSNMLSFLENIEIHLKTDNPIKIDIPLRNNSLLRIYQAPRVEESDDDWDDD